MANSKLLLPPVYDRTTRIIEMNESQKPFVCPMPGCEMSFINEDHLTVHKKKHDMMLTLEASSKNAAFFLDQTPTPTRFIRSCEDVGLFQDLHNVNPFDETFRRAVETGKNVTPSVLEATNDDTLHTPQIFPHISECTLAVNSILAENKTEDVVHMIENTETSNHEKTFEILKPVDLAALPTCESSTIPKTIPHQNESPTHLSINGSKVQLLLKTADGQLMQLLATPVSENKTNDSVIVQTEPSLSCATKVKKTPEISLAKVKLKQALKKNKRSINVKPAEPSIKSVESKPARKESPDHRVKQDILERNRASSMRCRAKRKAWVQELEETVRSVNETNAVLQSQMEALRNEVAKLNALLLAHKDCPVTKAMEKGTNIILAPKVVIGSDIVQSLPASQGAESQKRPNDRLEIPIAPKKLSTIAPKSPVLLPKTIVKPIILESAAITPSINKIDIGKMPITFLTISQPLGESIQTVNIVEEKSSVS